MCYACPPSPAAPPRLQTSMPSSLGLTFEYEVIDANEANPGIHKATYLESKVQHAVAALCGHHNTANTTELRMLRICLRTQGHHSLLF